MLFFTGASVCVTGLLFASVLAQTPLPQVDLGYETHQAISFNQTGQTYNFSNIRYAQPPVGDLRFAAPVPPTGRNTVIQNGSVARICPQAVPAWTAISNQFQIAYAAGNGSSFNLTQAEQLLQIALQTIPPAKPDPRASEDCLFLDVVVPKAVFDGTKSRHRRRQNGGAPVLIWIYGGGYTLGSKGDYANPSGLIKASQAGGNEGIIYVAMNYRLGALGWLSGSTLQTAGGVSNAGLYDQRLAIEWVSKYIHLFGGDPNKITIMGQSAGGGSVLHQITAFGGQKGVSFQRAIPQSPGYLPVTSNYLQENTTQTYLSLLNVTSIEQARNLSSEAVIRANTLQVGGSQYGYFSYGPVVDGVFVPAFPGILLSAGQFAKNISILASHMIDEAVGFTPPNVRTDDEFAAFIQTSHPGIAQPALDYIVKTLYPAKYDGSQPYTTPLQRTILSVSESIFTCNTNFLAKAFKNQTFAYEFQIPPGFHAEDVPYTFYNGQGTNVTTGLLAPIAQTLQGYITNFVKNGNPNGPGLPTFPMQGSNASMIAINTTYIRPQRDDTSNQRCAWFEKGLFF